MAKVKSNEFAFKKKAKVKRPEIHAKSKTSSLKQSKNYVKKYKGQGK